MDWESRVGPKGYIHGWVYVGPHPFVGQTVTNPKTGQKGTIAKISAQGVHVHWPSNPSGQETQLHGASPNAKHAELMNKSEAAKALGTKSGASMGTYYKKKAQATLPASTPHTAPEPTVAAPKAETVHPTGPIGGSFQMPPAASTGIYIPKAAPKSDPVADDLKSKMNNASSPSMKTYYKKKLAAHVAKNAAPAPASKKTPSASEAMWAKIEKDNPVPTGQMFDHNGYTAKNLQKAYASGDKSDITWYEQQAKALGAKQTDLDYIKVKSGAGGKNPVHGFAGTGINVPFKDRPASALDYLKPEASDTSETLAIKYHMASDFASKDHPGADDLVDQLSDALADVNGVDHGQLIQQPMDAESKNIHNLIKGQMAEGDYTAKFGKDKLAAHFAGIKATANYTPSPDIDPTNYAPTTNYAGHAIPQGKVPESVQRFVDSVGGPVIPVTNREAKEAANKKLVPLIGNGASKEAKAAVHEYTESSSTFNSQLRGHAPMTPSVKSKILEIDAAMKPTTQHMEVWRSTGTKQTFTGFHSGDIIADAAYSSTTLNATPKTSFGSTDMKIMIPAGTPAIYAAPISAYGSENELLLPRGQKFMVIGTEIQDNGRPMVHVMAIPDSALPTANTKKAVPTAKYKHDLRMLARLIAETKLELGL